VRQLSEARSPVVDAAVALAREAHVDHRRKGRGDVPYFDHLESVAARLRAFGYDDDVSQAAAYLHDLLEDRPAFGERMRAEMPPEVVATVEALTEKNRDELGAPLSKPDRVRAYVQCLTGGSAAALRAIPVSCADKIDNVTSMVEAQRSGIQILLELRTRPGQHAAQLAALRAVYAPVVRPEMLAAFDVATGELAELIRAWLPGRAVAIAATAHLGQVDKSGSAYILHPLRLMLRAATPEEQMIAVLHDVVEDSPWTLQQLADEGFPPTVVGALDRLTRRKGESYEEFIGRILEDPLASRVKLLDVEDNMNLARLPRITPADLERVERYHKARARLLSR
jgi:(p)ppGpp synthase/HD superfamily hydrolase